MATLAPTLRYLDPPKLFPPSSSAPLRRPRRANKNAPPPPSPPQLVAHRHCHPLELSGTGRRRREALVVRAGPPSTTSLLFAFAFPLSMIIFTVIASLRTADRLDEQYLEELERDKAIMEENEYNDSEFEDEEDDNTEYEDEEDDEEEEAVKENEELVVLEPAGAVVTRNRPKKLVQ